MTFVLLLVILAGNGPAMTTAEFHTMEACEAAGHKFAGQQSWTASVRYSCAPKGAQAAQPKD